MIFKSQHSVFSRIFHMILNIIYKINPMGVHNIEIRRTVFIPRTQPNLYSLIQQIEIFLKYISRLE
jgi:hypothetical protein